MSCYFGLVIAQPAERRIQCVIGYRTVFRSHTREQKPRLSNDQVDFSQECDNLPGQGYFVWAPHLGFLAGIVQMLVSKSNSFHSAERNSPGLTKTCGAILRAIRTVGWPSCPSIARKSPPSAFGSRIAARRRGFGVMRAPRRAPTTSCFARPVATAYRKTRLRVPRNRLRCLVATTNLNRTKDRKYLGSSNFRTLGERWKREFKQPLNL